MFLGSVKIGNNFKCCGIILFRNHGGNITLGDDVIINSHLVADPIGGQTRTIIMVGKNASISIGDRVGISNSAIVSFSNICIEDDTRIGAGVKIYDTDFHSSNPDDRLRKNDNVPSKSVHIGKNVFIGGHSIILKGVTIGDDSVVGAGSVVTKSIPAGEIWAGNPAKFIKKIQYTNGKENHKN